MAEKAGRPRVLHRRLVRDATEDEREHEKEVAKQANDASLVKGAVEAVLKRAPDLALLGGGYYLGAVMNMRPGLTIPTPLGEVFLGFPDFGGVIADLKEDVKGQQGLLDTLKRSATIIKRDDDCIASCEEARRFHERAGKAFDFDACVAACETEEFTLTPQIEDAEKELARLKGELRKHTIAQGILMATIVYAVTRAGFLQGVGEIIPG